MAFGKPVPDNSMMQPAVPNWSTSLHDPFDPKPVPDVATNRVNRSTFVFVIVTFWMVAAGLYGLGVATNKRAKCRDPTRRRNDAKPHNRPGKSWRWVVIADVNGNASPSGTREVFRLIS